MEENQNYPLIVAFVDDLMFAVQIESTAQRINCRLEIVESAGQILHRIPRSGVEDAISEEELDQALLNRIERWRPALLIFDLNNAHLPWRRWIQLVTSNPGSSHIPVLCFGSHTDVETTHAARSAGATKVVARSRFVSAMPELLSRLILRNDRM